MEAYVTHDQLIDFEKRIEAFYQQYDDVYKEILDAQRDLQRQINYLSNDVMVLEYKMVNESCARAAAAMK